MPGIPPGISPGSPLPLGIMPSSRFGPAGGALISTYFTGGGWKLFFR